MSNSEVFIPEEWLQTIDGGKLYYPSAWNDIADPLFSFCSFINEFVFCDINYDRGMHLEPALKAENGFHLLNKSITGDPNSILRIIDGHRNIEPSSLIEFYERDIDKRQFAVRRRRGFGQYGLLDFPPKSLSVFMHRGDGQREGGSNVFYLADLDSRHEPCGHLQSKLLERLKDKAIVISDGSNVIFPHQSRAYLTQLTEFHNSSIPCEDAYRAMADSSFDHGGFNWKCIGYMGRRNGPALAWGLTRLR